MKRVRAIILLNNKIVLIKRVKKSGVYWTFPGGGVNSGENNTEAIIRECKEELGVDIYVNSLFLKRKFKNQFEYFYICSIKNGVLGSGAGPEYQPNDSYEGNHYVEIRRIDDLKTIDLKPIEVKNRILDLTGKASRN